MTFLYFPYIYYPQFLVPEGEVEPSQLVADENIVSQLVSMGFNHHHCQKAAVNTFNAGVEEAMNWLLSHMDDPGTLEFWMLLCIDVPFQL